MVKAMRGSTASVADDVAAAETNLKEAQERLARARARCAQNNAASAGAYAAPPEAPSFSDVNACADAQYYYQTYQQNAPDPSAYQAAYAQQNYAPPSQPDKVAQNTRGKISKDHIAAAVLAILFGSLGIHKFYMGLTNVGFIVLAITILGTFFTFGASALVMALIGIVEGVIYLVKSQDEFERDYIVGKRRWF